MKEGCIEAIIYYINMLINGNLIPRDLEKAKRKVEKKINHSSSEYFYLLGRIFKKIKNIQNRSNILNKELKKMMKKAFMNTVKCYIKDKD